MSRVPIVHSMSILGKSQNTSDESRTRPDEYEELQVSFLIIMILYILF
jgi:hypothetical protein